MAKVPQLRLTNICKKYGSNTVLDNINLNVQPGEILFLVGKNGGGKSTLFNIILNLIFPDQGSVEINSARQNVGSCLTSLTLFPNKNAFENLKYYAMQLGIKKFEISLNPLFPLFTDEYKKPVKGFSSGMKKILSLAIAFLPTNLKLLLLDEPMEFLDMHAKEIVKAALMNYNKNGVTLLIASHNPEDISYFKGDCCFLVEGKIQQVISYLDIIETHETILNAYQHFNPEQ
jgi:ABC-2 type transport system ATP-binding protein